MRRTSAGFRLAVATVAVGCVLPWSAAFAQQVMVGARGGVTLPSASDLPLGPAFGLDTSFSMGRLVSAELTLEQSAHWVDVLEQRLAAWMTTWTVGVVYRLDVAPVVPYASLAIEGRRVSIPRAGTGVDYGASFAAGALVPITRNWHWGVEARYGIGSDGAFPTRQTYVLRLGWRNLDF